MSSRVLVAGPSATVAAVRRALPETEVAEAPSPFDMATMREADCLVVGTESEHLAETWQALSGSIPIVQLLLTEPPALSTLAAGDIPRAHVDSQGELRLALRTAVLQHRVQRLFAELAGAWAHDVRGALGVTRLALELLKSAGDPTGPLQKAENGVTRLGWLLERLPAQIALALDLPLPERTPPGLFPNLESYVTHLRLIHSRRPIELVGGEWTTSGASQPLVPFAAGFAELAFNLSPAKAKVRFSADRERGLEVECDCPGRPHPWNVEQNLGALELSRPRETPLPYRLVEVARLALRSDIPLTVEFTDRAFVGKVVLGERLHTL